MIDRGGSDGRHGNDGNAVTYYSDHERGKTADARITASWYGQSKNLKQRALQDALAYSEAA